MARNFPDWLTAYVQHASFSEAPKRMHFWCGVSALAGVLRRRVWFEQQYYQWYPNFYIVLVAPPGVVAKSTTLSIAMSLLKQVPGIKFGPDVVTWQALVTSFANSNESFQLPNGDYISQCALTLESSELGNLVNPTEREAMDLLVNLWDCKKGAFTKVTKGNGVDIVENPWINLIGCTTPAWIAGTFPEYIIGGGFTSRCLFVYADTKEKYIAYPAKHIPAGFESSRLKLVQDLEHISSTLVGPYAMTPEAEEWGETWYEYLMKNRPPELDDDRFASYIARKQTHVHKTAMILSASQKDELVISLEDLKFAVIMVTELEGDMQKVFSRIGRTSVSVQAERFVRFIQRHEIISYSEAYRYIHSAFPDVRNFEGIVKGAIAAGLIEQVPVGNQMFFRPVLAKPGPPAKLDS